MKINKNSKYYVGGISLGLFQLITVILFLSAWMEKNEEIMFLAGFAFLVFEIVEKAKEFYKNIAYILFLISFFVFLQGRYLVSIIFTRTMLTEFSAEIATHINLSIMISLLSLHFGYLIAHKVKFTVRGYGQANPLTVDNNYSNKGGNKIDVSLYLFYASAFFAVVSQLDIFFFVRNYSYVEYYLTYSSHVPRLLQVFGNMYVVFFIIFLCTYPPKEKCRIPIIVFVIISVLVLLTGDRGGMIQNISILVVYCLWRQKNEGEMWIKPRTIFLAVLLSPVIMALLSFFVYFREGLDVGALTFGAQLQRFLSISGRSANVLGYAIENQNRFPKQFYTFGGLIDYIKYNPISSALFGFSKPAPQTVEFAMNMHSFDSALSYFVYPQTYFNGHGIGSSYLAEVFYDFGYIGIVIISIIYSAMLNKCETIGTNSILKRSLMLLLIRGLYYAPRGPALIPITNILNITTIAAFAVYYFASKVKIRT